VPALRVQEEKGGGGEQVERDQVLHGEEVVGGGNDLKTRYREHKGRYLSYAYRRRDEKEENKWKVIKSCMGR
jgi:hypothetical protein